MRLPKPIISTWDGLKELGFVDDVEEPLAETTPTLRCRLGGRLDLRACLTVNHTLADIVLLSAEYLSARSFGQVDDEYPLMVESLDQLAALIADTASKVMAPTDPVGPLPVWFLLGSRNKHLLPEQQAIAEYEARPHCRAQRDWVKLAFKALAKHLGAAPDDVTVRFSFDGSVLSIRCGELVSPIPADGKAWPATYTVAAKHLRRLPNRFPRDRPIHFGIWESELQIANRCFGKVEAEMATVSTSEHQP